MKHTLLIITALMPNLQRVQYLEPTKLKISGHLRLLRLNRITISLLKWLIQARVIDVTGISWR